MTSTKSLRVLLGSVSAAALIAGFAGAASAQTTVFGGGATLPSNAIRDVANCFANPQAVNFNPPLHNSAGCVAPGVDSRLWGYASVGSGAGRRSFVRRDSNLLGVVPSTTFNIPFADNLQTIVPARPKLVYDNVLPGVGYGSHHYSLSEEQIFQTNPADPTTSLDCYQGAIGGCTDQRIIAGEAMQMPFVATTVNVAFNIPNRTSQIRLTRAAYCGIFNGTITNWNDPIIKAGNSGNSVIPAVTNPDPNAVVPISAVFQRADSSGTSFLISNHLATVCSGFPLGFTGSTSPTQWPNFIYRIPGNNGVANAVAKTAFSAGYITPEASAPFAATVSTIAAVNAAQQAPLTGIISIPAGTVAAPLVSRLQNQSLAFIAPNPGAASNAMAAAVPPSGAAAANPANWANAGTVADTSNPTGYPISGFNWFMNYTCYSSSGVAGSIRGFWSFVLNNPTFDQYREIAGLRGLASMPSAWRIAQREHGLKVDATEISPANSTARNPNCDTDIFPLRTGA